MMTKIFQVLVLFVFCLTIGKKGTAQITINGPANCIIPGQEYVYTMSGNWSSTDIPQMQWCAPGKIQANQSYCITGQMQIRVVYDADFSGGTITLWAPSGSASLSVSTSPGPFTDGNYLEDAIAYTDSIPPSIGTYRPTGGNCEGAGYIYQWEMGTSATGPFTAIAGANQVFLTPPVSSVEKTVYLRRKATYNGTDVYTTVGSLTYVHEPVSGGQIYVSGSNSGAYLPYGTSPEITQMPGRGWQCSQSGISYKWWYKVNPNGTPQLIGTGAEYPSGGPVLGVNDIIIYREATCGSTVSKSNDLYLNILPLNPGSIYVDDTIAIAGIKPQITQLPAQGGRCAPASLQYQWQQSPNGTNWQNIGTGADYPAAAPAFTTNMRIRRQVTCGAQVAYSNELSFGTFTEDFLADNRTFVVSTEVHQSGVTDTTAVTALAIGDKQRSTVYYDGLGRITQIVRQQAGGSGKDLVQLKEYDTYGREENNYIPYTYVASNARSTSTNGKYKISGIADQQDFYQQLFPGEVSNGKTIYEQSPLNRPSNNLAAGSSWVGSNRGKTTAYKVNGTEDQVRIWNIAVGAAAIPVTNKIYPAGMLDKKIVTDEQGMQIVQYQNKNGQLILKKVQLAATANLTAAHDGWLCTYYIYDDVGNLRCVISPKGVEAIKGNWVLGADVMNGLCFQYQYDDKQRVISKRNPGASTVLLVYDQRDRIVFTQDGRMLAKKQWHTVFYDELNRPVMTALYNKDITQQALQASLNNAGGNVTLSNTLSAPGSITIAWHDGRPLYQAADSIMFVNGFESGSSEFETNLSPLTSTVVVNANNPLPGIAADDLYPLIYTYYDDYSFSDSRPFQPGEMSTLENGDNPVSPQVVTAALKTTRSAVTGSMVRVVGTNRWLTTTNYYDDKTRLIQSISDNLSGASDIASIRYDFSGKILSTCMYHSNLLSGVTPHTRVVNIYSYDKGGRVLSIKQKLNGQTNATTISRRTYNDLGQLISNVQGNNLNTEKTDYNIRGWVLGINRKYVNNQENGYFGYELAYDKTASAIGGVTYATPQYTGNIAGTTWKGSGDQRKYDYSYDNVNRLLRADFLTNTGGSWNKTNMDFSVKMGDGIHQDSAYDANGNILRMQQNGLKGVTSATVDDLHYRYVNNTNQLQHIWDGSNDENSSLGDFKEPAQNSLANKVQNLPDYVFDVNGNMTSDKNRRVDSIVYNYLDFPEKIFMFGKGTVEYLYDANGIKLRKLVTDSTTNPISKISADYYNGLEYKNDTLRFLAHEEGRVRFIYKSGAPVITAYDYFLKDHLGNVREVLSESSDASTYLASMESAADGVESALFSNISNTRAPKPVGYPADGTTSPNDYVSKLNAVSGQKIGASLVLRVMAGDTIQVGSKAFYKSTAANTAATTTANMLSALLQAFGGAGEQDGVHSATGPGSPLAITFNNTAYDQLKQKDPSQNLPDKPRAYLNYVMFDDQFNMVNENSGIKQVQGTPDALQTLGTDRMVIRKTGFVYIYTSNESSQDVFFDNLVVVHNNGPLLQETHYYPFGLTMAGISANALKGTAYMENQLKYNGKELQRKEFKDGSGLEWYDYGARMYNVQVGRFDKIDRYTEQMMDVSPYHYVNNNPILYIDINGDSTVPSGQVNWPSFDVRNNQIGLGTVEVRAQSGNNATMPWYMFGGGNGFNRQMSQQQGEIPGAYRFSTYSSKPYNGRMTLGLTGIPLDNYNVQRWMITKGMGRTITNKVAITKGLNSGILGDKFSYTHSSGPVSGTEGKIITLDVATANDELESAAITVLGIVTVRLNTDISVSVGVGAAGYEVHVTAGMGVGMGQLGAGASSTTNGVVSGGDLTIRPGLVTLGAVLLSPLLAF